jgi:hypothetical protein
MGRALVVHKGSVLGALALSTGLRQSEWLGLRWKQVDLAAATPSDGTMVQRSRSADTRLIFPALRYPGTR